MLSIAVIDFYSWVLGFGLALLLLGLPAARLPLRVVLFGLPITIYGSLAMPGEIHHTSTVLLTQAELMVIAFVAIAAAPGCLSSIHGMRRWGLNTSYDPTWATSNPGDGFPDG